MPIIEPTPVDAAPAVPDRADRATFPQRMYNAFVYLFGVFRTGITNLAANVYNNATEANNAALTAASAAGAAGNSANTATAQAGIATAKASEALASANAAAAIAGAFVGTSASSLTIGTGNKTFDTQTGEQYTTGIWMTAVSASNSANWMFGQVVSYSGTTLVIDVQATGGSGTYSDWNLSLTGARGPAGLGITPQSVGFTMTGGTAAKTLTVDRDATISELMSPYTAVASGAINDGDFVELMNDGTVRVAQYLPIVSAGAVSSVVDEYINSYAMASCYDSYNDKIVLMCGRSTYPTAVVGTVSGTSISFGTPVTINADSTATTSSMTCCFDSTNNKVVVFYAKADGKPYSRVGTVSGTSISFGAETSIPWDSAINGPTCCFDTTNSKIVYFGRDTNLKSVVGTVSGTSISFGAPTDHTVKSAYQRCIYIPSINRIVLAYRNESTSNYGFAAHCYVSGTSVTGFSQYQFDATVMGQPLSCCYDSHNDKVLILYNSASVTAKAVVATVAASSMTFSNPVVVKQVNNNWNSCTYDPVTERVFWCYIDQSTGYLWVSHGRIVNGVMTFNNPIVYQSAASIPIVAGFDETNNKPVLFYFSGSKPKAAVCTMNDLLKNRWVGVAESTVANGETLKIITPGSVASNQSGLVTGETYSLNENGALKLGGGSFEIGTALSPTQMLLRRG